ncbi:MAG: exodeoxyribonuclease V subunit alpha, partial [Gemmatimonadaceae bacterium]
IRARVAGHDDRSLPASAPRFRALFPQAGPAPDWQAMAAAAALRSSLVFVTGGPGTGKTTVAAKLLALLLDRDPSLRLAVAAPTGRAAARLVEAIGAAASREALGDLITPRLPTVGTTLHRLLGYQPWNDCFRHHAGRPLADDVVVVDEASMVDVLLMDALFAAVKPSARLIVLGDPDQLASVDTGFVLGDVARATQRAGLTTEQPSPALAQAYATLSGASVTRLDPDASAGALRDAVVRLRVSYRFGQQPGIGALAEATRRGDAARALAVLDDAAHPDVSRQDPDDSAVPRLTAIAPLIEAYLSTTEPAAALEALARFRILCALREGEAGVTGLNASVEQWLQRRGDVVTGWYDHRPVLITANDPGTSLFNGDVGTTLAVDGVPMVHFPVPGGGVRSFTPSRLPAYETAWAMTVHKSQGSEFDHVVLVLPDSDTRVLTRELVYTGITRARRAVTVIATAEILQRAAARTVARSSGLVERLA